MSTLELQFSESGERVRLGDGITLLRRFSDTARLMPLIERVAVRAPFRHLVTPGGQTMSVAMTNCGPVGWVSDRSGYRYSSRDPMTDQDWPAMPDEFLRVALDAASACGFPDFVPDACLINRYSTGARLTAHRDADEQNFAQPIVSVSLGLPARFAFHGLTRAGKSQTVALADGDVLVWGGPSRLAYHAVRPIKAGLHPLTGAFRFNLTFRHAR
jgi:alkylated DNA repair protein (DNA oxidative demethylase)